MSLWKRVKSHLTIHVLFFLVFLISTAVFLLSRLYLNSYNMELSQYNYSLTSEITQKQKENDQLEVDINLLQEKNQILDTLDNQLVENYENIYVKEE